MHPKWSVWLFASLCMCVFGSVCVAVSLCGYLSKRAAETVAKVMAAWGTLKLLRTDTYNHTNTQSARTQDQPTPTYHHA